MKRKQCNNNEIEWIITYIPLTITYIVYTIYNLIVYYLEHLISRF